MPSTRRMPLPPPPATALISSGKPIPPASSRSRGSVLVGPVIARHQRHAGRRQQRLGAVLAAQPLHRLGRRPDEDQPRVAHRPRERRTLRQEAVTRMDRRRPGPPRRLQHPLDQQIALRRRRRAQPHRLVGHAAHAARRGRHPNRPPPCGRRAAGRSRRSGRRSRRDWRSAGCRTPSSPPLGRRARRSSALCCCPHLAPRGKAAKANSFTPLRF